MKIDIGKNCDINILKGTSYKDFKKQNLISKRVATVFLKSKNKKVIKNCLICNHKKLNQVAKILKIEFLQCNRCNHVFSKYRNLYKSNITI